MNVHELNIKHRLIFSLCNVCTTLTKKENIKRRVLRVWRFALRYVNPQIQFMWIRNCCEIAKDKRPPCTSFFVCRSFAPVCVYECYKSKRFCRFYQIICHLCVIVIIITIIVGGIELRQHFTYFNQEAAISALLSALFLFGARDFRFFFCSCIQHTVVKIPIVNFF